jgi:DNA-directed RNA polymerase specialized sigma24 family protein
VKTESPGDRVPSHGNRNGWLCDEPAVQEKLCAIAHHLQPGAAYPDWEDLLQEGLLQLWRAEQKCPGQTASWYLKNADLYLHNVLRAGRSLDSAKRSSWRVEPLLEPNEEAQALEKVVARTNDRDIMSQIYADNFVEELRCRLNGLEAAVFDLLLQERGVREIAHFLHISSRM